VEGGEGWVLVRHAAPGNQWHGATDRLGGIDVYGDPAGGPLSAAEWSIAFNVDDVSAFLFATGDCENWLIASKEAVIGEYYADVPRHIMQSSTSSEPYMAQWYNRDAIADGYPHDEDPWISLGDHAASVADGSIVYGENHFGHSHAELVLPVHNGANVFVQLIAPLPSSPCEAAVQGGDGWTLVRHAAPGNQWHRATDRLGGTDVYGDQAGGPLSAAEWSIAFNVDDVSEFLFATGDCENWLIASKDAVIGEYYAEPRQIIQSSTSSEPYTALWLNRETQFEDPWISLGDHNAGVADGSIVYGENHFGHSHAELVLPVHNGANVFVKLSTASLCSCQVTNYLGHLPPMDTQGQPETVTTVNEWLPVRGGISSLDVAGNCIVRVATGAAGAGEHAHRYAQGGHAYPMPTGNDNIQSIRLECV